MIRFLTVTALFCATLTAAPKLRLATAAVGPVFITQGQTGATQTVAASNAGDGGLTLTATPNVSWITASIGAGGVQMGLNTATLARGKYTGVVTVNDPNAVDAPQTITVTIQVGDAVPDSVDLYMPPGGSASTSFSTGTAVTLIPAPTAANGLSLSVASTGGGSFSFSNSYQVSVAAAAGAATGDYSLGFSVTGGVTKSVPVGAHVTSLPIGQWTNPGAIRVAQGAAPAVGYVSFANAGLGSLTLSGVTGNPSWLTASFQGTLLTLTADPTAMTPGTYTATISVASNARNGPFAIPVEMDVLTPGPAWTYYQHVVDNVTFQPGGTVAPGEWVALFGEQLTTGAPALGTFPLGKPVGGAAVFVNDQPAPVYYVSAGQIDFVIPFGTQPGDATVRVDRDEQRGNSVSMPVTAAAPRLLRLGIGDYANAQLNGTATLAIPATSGIASQPAKAGQDVVVFYAFGMGQTVPAAADGVPVTGGTVSGTQVIIGESVLPNSGLSVTPDYAGFTPGFVGVYQINVRLPANTTTGSAVPVYLNMNGVISNKVNIAIQ
ncbi:MAG TPA: hypothetical protein VGN17_29855 [Bryobacteraceae bacterium]